MELARRWILLVSVILAIWAAKWASTEPLFVVRAVDFAAEQKDESAWTDRGRFLAQLPLDGYVAFKIKEAGLPVSGEAWAEFFREAGALSRGEGPDKSLVHRVPSDALRWRSTPYRVFYRPDEAPLDSVSGGFSKDEEICYLTFAEGGKTAFLSLTYQTYDGGDFAFGSGFSGTPKPPVRFLYPFRIWSPWILLAGLAAYTVLPRRKKESGALAYQTWRIVLGDFAAMILFTVFFAIPIFVIGGSLQAVTQAWPLALILWPLAFAGVWLLRLGAWYASYRLTLSPSGIELSTYKSRRLFSFGEMAYYQPVILKPPRWLVIASWIGAMAPGRGSARFGTAGRALILGGSASHGVGIGLKDGTKAFFWVTDQMGGKALRNAEKMPGALESAGVPRKEEAKVLSSLILPVGEDARGKRIAEGSGLSLAFVFLVPLAAIAVLSMLFLFASSSGAPKTRPAETAGDAESDAAAALAVPEADWVVSLGTGEITAASVVAPTADGGFVVLGRAAESGTDLDAFFAKVDGNGKLLWSKTYPGDIDEFGQLVCAAGDGGFFLAGEKRRLLAFAAGSSDGFLIKTGADGEKIWDRSIGEADRDDIPLALAPAAGGGVKMLLRNPSGLEVLEWSSAGEPGGRKAIPLFAQLAAVEGINAAAFLPDGGFVLAGEEQSGGPGYLDAFIARADRGGRILWKRTSGGPGKETAAAVIPLSDGGFAAAGTVDAFDADGTDVYVLRTNAEGEVQGEYGHGGPGNQSGSAILESKAGRLLVFGASRAGEAPAAVFGAAIERGKTEIQSQTIPRGRFGGEAAAACAAGDGSVVIAVNRTTGGFSTTAVDLIKIRK